MVRNPPAMQKMQVPSLGQYDPLEKKMATHFSILAWEIPRKEEPGRPQSTGSQRIGHSWACRAVSSTVTEVSPLKEQAENAHQGRM